MRRYCDKFDIYFDDETLEYLEKPKNCGDKSCPYCPRPKTIAKLKEICDRQECELLGGSICPGLHIPQ